MPHSLGWRRHPVILNDAVPVLSVGVVLTIGRWLDLYFRAAPVSLFICAVMFSAWLGGLRPGLLATVLSVLALKYYFEPPLYSLAVATAETPRLVVFSLAALFVGSLSAGQRSATEALRKSEQRFRDYAESASDWHWETGPDHAFTLASRTPGSASGRTRRPTCSRRSTRRSRVGSAWGSRSVGRSLTATAVDSGPRRTRATVPLSIWRYRVCDELRGTTPSRSSAPAPEWPSADRAILDDTLSREQDHPVPRARSPRQPQLW